MKETQRTKFIRNLYSNQIKDLYYEDYIDIDKEKKIRTYMVIVDGGYETVLRLQHFGIFSEETVEYLKSLGYKSKEEYTKSKTLKM